MYYLESGFLVFRKGFSWSLEAFRSFQPRIDSFHYPKMILSNFQRSNAITYLIMRRKLCVRWLEMIALRSELSSLNVGMVLYYLATQ